jgi:2-dehydropantoate 2-reductase
MLARAGYPVAMIARGEHLRAIQEHGLRVQTPKGDFTVTPSHATDTPAEVGPVDAILIGTKAWQVPQAAEAVRPMIGPGTKVVPLQNGVDAMDQLAQVLGWEHVTGGLCRVIAAIAAPGVVRLGGMEPVVILGEMDGAELSGSAKALYDAFRRAGVNVQIAPDIQVALWEKLLFIAGVSGTGAVARATIGEWRQCLETRELLQQIMEEVAAVARRRGVGLADDAVDRAMGFVDTLPYEGTASMQRDIADGRPSELEAITGAIVRFGSTLDVPTPANAFVYAALLPQEMRARGKSSP